jgi:hypothetical protein
MIVVYENAGRYSAASSAGVLFYNLRYEAAAITLADAGFPIALLESPVDGLTWRSTLTAAFANEIQALNQQVAALAPSSDVDDVRERQDALAGQLDHLQRAIRLADLRTEIARAEAELDRQLPLMRQLMPRSPNWEVNAMVAHGPAAKRLASLVAEWRSLQ